MPPGKGIAGPVPPAWVALTQASCTPHHLCQAGARLPPSPDEKDDTQGGLLACPRSELESELGSLCSQDPHPFVQVGSSLLQNSAQTHSYPTPPCGWTAMRSLSSPRDSRSPVRALTLAQGPQTNQRPLKTLPQPLFPRCTWEAGPWTTASIFHPIKSHYQETAHYPLPVTKLPCHGGGGFPSGRFREAHTAASRFQQSSHTHTPIKALVNVCRKEGFPTCKCVKKGVSR